MEGNLGPHWTEAQADEWSAVGFGFGKDGVAPGIYRSPERFPAPTVSTQPARTALQDVLTNAGATRPRRDAIDQRIVEEVKTRKGAIIDSPGQAGGYGRYSASLAPMDSDGDDLPDDWEKSTGLNPMDAADGSGDLDADGYTNLEEFLHSRLQ